MGDMELYTLEEVKDRLLGPVGTPERDKHDSEVAEALRAYFMGEAIKKARKSKKLTQKQLGERMGVKRAQVSRIEKGNNLTFSTIARAFRAMGVPAAIEMSGVGRVELW
ncbi:MAG: helix-turn-helix domain-containing protein [Bacteroidales bacterium]|nr:helix-turn-helix domain-containing protein [Bacteroidales bacterium]